MKAWGTSAVPTVRKNASGRNRFSPAVCAFAARGERFVPRGVAPAATRLASFPSVAPFAPRASSPAAGDDIIAAWGDTKTILGAPRAVGGAPHAAFVSPPAVWGATLFIFVSPHAAFVSPQTVFVSPPAVWGAPHFTFMSPHAAFVSPHAVFVSPLLVFIAPLFIWGGVFPAKTSVSNLFHL